MIVIVSVHSEGGDRNIGSSKEGENSYLVESVYAVVLLVGKEGESIDRHCCRFFA